MRKISTTIPFPLNGLNLREDHARQGQAGFSVAMANVWPVNVAGQRTGGSRQILQDGTYSALTPLLTTSNVLVGNRVMESDADYYIIHGSAFTRYGKTGTVTNYYRQHDGTNIADVTIPFAATCGCIYKDRMFVGNSSGVWYASKTGQYDIYGLGGNTAHADVTRAIAGKLADAGTLAGSITAMFTVGEVLAIATPSRIWLVNGDLVNGGMMACVSKDAGVISKNAFTVLPDHSVVFVGRQGVYRWSGQGSPVLISEERIPGLLQNLSTAVVEYDGYTDGVFIFTSAGNYWLDSSNNFWPMALLTSEKMPARSIRYNNRALFITSSGIQTFGVNAEVELDSVVTIGPVSLSQEGESAVLSELWGQSDGTVTWELFSGDTAYDVVRQVQTPGSVGIYSGTCTETLVKSWIRLAGQFVIIRLTGTGQWSFGNITAIVNQTRRKRW